MFPRHHSTAPTGLGKGSERVLMVASIFSASSFPQDNMEAAGTYPNLELHNTCEAMPALLGSRQGCLSLAAARGEAQVVHGCTSGTRRAASPAQRQGWAALMPMFVFTLPKPAALSPLSQEPQIFGLAPAFGSWPERTGSQHNKLSGEAVYHYHWGNYTLSDKNLQGLMWCKILLKGAGMGNSVCFLPLSAPNSNLSCICFLDLLINLWFFRFYPLLPFSVLAFEVRSKH